MQLDLSPIPGLFEGGNNGRGTGGKFQRLGHDDQLGQGVRLHFLHHPRPMHLYGLFDDPELSGDLLVQQPFHDEPENLALTERQRLDALLQVQALMLYCGLLTTPRDRFADGRNQGLACRRVFAGNPLPLASWPVRLSEP